MDDYQRNMLLSVLMNEIDSSLDTGKQLIYCLRKLRSLKPVSPWPTDLARTKCCITRPVAHFSIVATGLVFASCNAPRFGHYGRTASPRPFRTRPFYYSASYALLSMPTAVIDTASLSLRLSICPSRSGVLSRWMKIRSCHSCGLDCQTQVGQSLSGEVKIIRIFAGDYPRRGR